MMTGDHEWRFLVAIARAGTQSLPAHLLAGTTDLDAGELVAQAVRHKLLHRLAWQSYRGHLGDLLPRGMRVMLRGALLLNRHTTRIQRIEAVRVSAALDSAGVAHCCTKGISIESSVYGGHGARTLSDIDFLVKPADRATTLQILQDLGFNAYSKYDWPTDTLTMSRQESMMYRLNPDHLPHHARRTGDPLIPIVDVDVANSLTWTRSPWQAELETALHCREQLTVPEGVLPVLAPPYQLVHCIMHLFREAWMLRLPIGSGDVNLAKFSDVHQLALHHAEELDDFAELVHTLELVEPVGWVLRHLDRVLDVDISARLGIGEVSEDWLRTATLQGQTVRWHGDMTHRLRIWDRQSLFHAAQSS